MKVETTGEEGGGEGGGAGKGWGESRQQGRLISSIPLLIFPPREGWGGGGGWEECGGWEGRGRRYVGIIYEHSVTSPQEFHTILTFSVPFIDSFITEKNHYLRD